MSIATEITRLQTAKADLKTAIEGKGVTVPSTTKIDGYADLVESIPSGGGGDNEKYLSLIARTGTSFEDESVVTTGTRSFGGWTSLVNLSLPNLQTIGGESFYGSTGITVFHFPKVTTINGANAFNNAGTTTSVIVLPAISGGLVLNNINSFRGVAVDLGPGLTSFAQYVFQSSANFNTLILRSESLVSLGSINSFNNTPFASGKVGGTLYVPSALISSYEAATNWSTILGYSTNSIAAIEGSQYENYYADGTPISA